MRKVTGFTRRAATRPERGQGHERFLQRIVLAWRDNRTDWLPDGVLKIKSRASGHKSCALSLVCRSRRRETIQLCNLIGRRLLERLVSEKHHFPFSLRILRTMLTVCRAQSMSCHLRPKYSLGRIPVVSATASTAPYLVPSAALSNVLACSTVRDRISFRTCCGTLSPSAGFSSNKRHRTACCIAHFISTCA
jgi:hypothetical protein